MFKHCLSKFSCALVMMCALVTGGLFQSCEDLLDLDEYKYDDSEPSWLGASIYEFLNTGNAGHTYTNYVKLIDDLGQKEILSRTGSRTMFIADDAAFDRFYESNTWGVRSYDDLTYRQKRVLLFNVMLKNAYLLDMLAATTVNPNVEQIGGDCLRRETMATMYDSVPLFSENATINGLRFPEYNEAFEPYKELLQGKNIRVAIGNKNPMMVHFLYEYVRTQNIQDEDFRVMFQRSGKTRTGTEAFIFENKILTSDISYGDLSDDTLTITCKNGYLYRMDDVLVPPSNMAQLLRETEDTRLFSRMLDRFAYLEYSDSYTEAFNALYHEGKPEDNENVYLLKYALETLNGQNRSGQPYYTPDENGKAGKDFPKSKQKKFGPDDFLKYDPGDAQYASSNGLQSDMAAMLVPNDTMVYRFFTPEYLQDTKVIDANYTIDSVGRRVQLRPYGVGASIIETYSNKEDVANLKEVANMNYVDAMIPCLDSIPAEILSAFICNLMQTSFLNTIPSNFSRVRNDARDDMGLKPDDVDDCIVANNGVIYILNNVYGPAKYQAVLTPPYVMTNMRIMGQIIKAPALNYESYLLAMDSKYSFIVPDDTCFVYYDPATLKTTEPTAYVYSFGRLADEELSVKEHLISTKCQFDPATYAIIDTLEEAKTADISTHANRFRDMMEYLIIVDEVEGVRDGGPDMNQYYLSKGYGIVKCVKNTDGSIKFFQGGEQIELSRARGAGNDVAVTVKERGRFQEKNGVTYCTESDDVAYKSGVVSPPTKSIYSYLSENVSGNNPFYEFYNLTNALTDVEIYLKIFGLTTGEDDAEALQDSLTKYRIFSDVVNGYYPYDQAVPFLSTYHYTVYVPQAEALQRAFDAGLPQYDDIKVQVDAGNYGRAASMIRLLNKFIRYHFQDNSVVVDHHKFRASLAGGFVDSARYETATIDDKTGRFFDLLVKSDGGTITVKDNLGRTVSVMNESGKEGESWNIFTRDLLFTSDPTEKGATIATSSFAVVHQINDVLYNSGLFGYDGKFRRFAKDGELVDSMTVASVPTYDATAAATTYAPAGYRVGKAGKYLVETEFGADYIETAYLMKDNGSKDHFVQEDYILLGDTAKILITENGHLIDTINGGFQYLWADLTPLPLDTLNNVNPDSIVTVLPNGVFVDKDGKEIKK